MTEIVSKCSTCEPVLSDVTDRARSILRANQDQIARRTDRLLGGLIFFQWGVAIEIALTISPWLMMIRACGHFPGRHSTFAGRNPHGFDETRFSSTEPRRTCTEGLDFELRRPTLV